MGVKKQIMSSKYANVAKNLILWGTRTAGLWLRSWMSYHRAKITGQVAQKNKSYI